MDWITAVLFYLLGAFTFIPLMLWLAQLYITIYQAPAPSASYDYAAEQENKADVTTGHNYGTKEGWVMLSSDYQPTTSSAKRRPLISGGVEGYGVFKQGILKVYSNESKHRCEWTLDLNDYNVSIYPPGRQEHTLFSRSVALRLQRKQQSTSASSSSSSSSFAIGDEMTSTASTTPKTLHGSSDLYFTCTRPIDKEDWYFAFMSVASESSSCPRRAIPFDPMAVASLISFVGKETYQYHQHQTSDHHTPIPWFNAVLGRTFLGIYKTHRLQQYVFETLAKKTLKMKTPGFLGDIQVRSVDLGYAIPFVTNPTLVELCPDGTLVLDALVDYRGGFKVVVEANAGGGGVSFSIRVPLVLSLTLQSLSGTIRFKIKPPPSNRYWIGFCTMPTMKWSILPAVSNYNVKLSMITKIIEAKIRRLMTENMVLPNMADIPFAKSDGKGGIFHEVSKGDDDVGGSGAGNDNEMAIHHADMVSSGDDGGGDDDDDDDGDKDLESSQRHSFLIHNNTHESSSMMDALSPSMSSGRWSKFFANRRRKTNTTMDDKSAQDEQAMDNEQPSKVLDQQSDGNVCRNDADKRSHGDDSNKTSDTDHNTTTTMGDFGGPMYLSPSSTSSTLIKRSSATSLATAATESGPTSTASSTTLGADDDTSSIRSAPRKRIYNAAGYLLSKGKGLANDFREHRQQDLQLKRQQSLLHYGDQLQDMRRRYDENTLQRLRRSSTASSSSSSSSSNVETEITTITTLLDQVSSNPPLHLIHNDNNSNSADNRTLTSTTNGASQAPFINNEKPPLPPRPTTRPISIPSNSSNASGHDEAQIKTSDSYTITTANNDDDAVASSSSPSSSSSARIPIMNTPPPMIPTAGNT